MSLPTTDQIKQIITKTKAGYQSSALSVAEAVEKDLENYVPNSRKVNNKPLSEDITISAADLGALGENDRACITTLSLTKDLWQGTEATIDHSLASNESCYAFVITPAPGDNIKTWQSCNVVANEPTASAFTFSCSSTPNETITVNVLRIKAKEV